jgi:hypothetical protein
LWGRAVDQGIHGFRGADNLARAAHDPLLQ